VDACNFSFFTWALVGFLKNQPIATPSFATMHFPTLKYLIRETSFGTFSNFFSPSILEQIINLTSHHYIIAILNFHKSL
jgi:hypothetical protein